jgi:membrane-bound lytic murein transglycosylase A
LIQKVIARLGLSLGMILLTSSWQMVRALPLQPVSAEKIKHIGIDRQLQANPSRKETTPVYRFRTNPSCPNAPRDDTAKGWNQSNRANLVKAINDSLSYLSTPKAAQAYLQYSPADFNLDRVRRSLVRFKELLLTTNSPEELATKVKQEFVFYQSSGNDDRGTVEFTGYFEPSYAASPIATSEYRYPIYRQPSNFDRWSKPHPTRAQLEGTDGLSGNNFLSGSELVWLRDRLEAFLIQVQGSARLNLTDGRRMTVGYDSTTDYDYTSIGGELVKDGIFTKEELSLPKAIAHFKTHPQDLDKYIPRNNRFVFFRETNGAKPTGSLGVPVTGDRSIATDKSLMPPGALALIVAPITDLEANGEIMTRVVSRYVLDHDTGSAIKGAGRVDVFLGSGTVAGERAGRLNGSGNLFYLLLKQ